MQAGFAIPKFCCAGEPIHRFSFALANRGRRRVDFADQPFGPIAQRTPARAKLEQVAQTTSS